LRLANGGKHTGQDRQGLRVQPRTRDPGLARNTGPRGDRIQHAPRTAQSRPQQVRQLPRTSRM
ncbi:MAG: hypothetical protein ABI604_07155, partial [Nitrospirota bacterium]